MTNYSKADTKTQWFQDDFPGADMNLSEATEVVVLHTTESSSWPGYDGGSKAPTYTAMPDIANRKLIWRGHFPDEKSARALVNATGGVETNTLNCVQVEMVGTCDPKHSVSWDGLKAGVDYIYWPDAPYWALRAVADFLADQHIRHGLQLRTLPFLAYPASYGANAVRLTGSQWRAFAGVCGHQHVPENVHGDPGDIDIAAILKIAKEIVDMRLNPKRPVLRVATVNLREHNPSLGDALTLLVKQDADVICVQEAAGAHAKIQAALGGTHRHFGSEGGSHGHREVQLWIRKDIKVFDHGEFQATKFIPAPHNLSHDRWVSWALVEWAGHRLNLVAWHANAGIQDKQGRPKWSLARTHEYRKEIVALEAFLKGQQGGGFAPIIGGDTNYNSARALKFLHRLWKFSPNRMFARLGLRSRASNLDKIAWPDFLNEAGHHTVQAPGCDHRWLFVDLEAMK